MIVYQSRFLKRGEVWFDEPVESTPVDWILYHQCPSPPPNSRWRYFYTRLIDLRRSPDELLNEMDKNTLADLRKARERDKTVFERLNAKDPRVMDEFVEAFQRFSAQKGLWDLDRGWMDRTAEAGALELWMAKTPEGEPLIYNSVVLAGGRARGLYMATFRLSETDKEARRRSGCANRGLLWEIMLQYQRQGVHFFDFGGWYNGSTDQDKLNINRFKKGFGGFVVREYECEQIRTWRGRLLLGLARKLGRIEAREESAPETPESSPAPAPVSSPVQTAPAVASHSH